MKRIKNYLAFWLKKTERHTKTDMTYLVSGSFWLLFAQGINLSLGLIPTIIFANFFPTQLYGQYTFIMSIFSILSITALGGTTTAYISAVSRGNEGDFIPIIKEKIQWGLLGTLGAIALAGYYFFQQDVALGQATLLIALFIPVTNTFLIFKNLLVGRKLFKLSAKYSFISRILTVAALAPVVYFSNNLLLVLLAFFAPKLIVNLFFCIHVYIKSRPNTNRESGILRYSKHLSIIGILGEVANHIDKILIFHYIGSVEVAMYFVATTVPNQMRMLLQNITTLLLPRFAKHSYKSVANNMMRKSVVMIIFIIAVIIVYIIAAPFIYQLIFPKFTESVFYTQLFSITLLSLASTLPTAALQSHQRTKRLYATNVSNHIIHIALLFIGVYFWGIIGIIVAKIIAKITEAIVNYAVMLYKK